MTDLSYVKADSSKLEVYEGRSIGATFRLISQGTNSFAQSFTAFFKQFQIAKRSYTFAFLRNVFEEKRFLFSPI